MAKSKIVKVNEEIAKKVIGGHKKVEKVVVESYRKIENAFIDRYLTHDGESIEEAKVRIHAKQAEQQVDRQ